MSVSILCVSELAIGYFINSSPCTVPAVIQGKKRNLITIQKVNRKMWKIISFNYQYFYINFSANNDPNNIHDILYMMTFPYIKILI